MMDISPIRSKVIVLKTKTCSVGEMPVSINAFAKAFTLFCLFALTSCADQRAPVDSNTARPNVLLIVADDLGYADLGAFGGEINTPNLDRLAMAGIRFSDFQAAPTCSPSRAMLLTGVTSHKAGLGNMIEEMAPNQEGQPGYEGHLNHRVLPLPEILQNSGYQTFMVGKWHLGMTEQTSPKARGFDRSFAMLSGGASHYFDMKPAYAPSPDVLAPYRHDETLLTELPENFDYSSEFFVDELIRYLDEGDARPFFAMLSYTAPHWPLQAPSEAIQTYKGKYDQGYDVLASERLENQKALGLIDANAAVAPRYPGEKPWDQLSETERQTQSRAMEIYAAMVDRLDFHTGRLLNYLEQKGRLENTIVIFLSDNGPEGHDLLSTWPPDQFPDIYKWVVENHDFSYEAMGKKDSYTLYGPSWANAGSPAFRLHKGFSGEGGTHVPAFIHYPSGGFQAGIEASMVSIIDITPTILDLLDIEVEPDETIEPVTGYSLKPLLVNGAQEELSRRALVFELMNKRVVRQQNWKLVLQPKPVGTGQWQLFNIAEDASEQNDLSEQYPQKVAELKSFWQDYVQENGVIIPDWVSGY